LASITTSKILSTRVIGSKIPKKVMALSKIHKGSTQGNGKTIKNTAKGI
jgi:hypothetical protein